MKEYYEPNIELIHYVNDAVEVESKFVELNSLREKLYQERNSLTQKRAELSNRIRISSDWRYRVDQKVQSFPEKTYAMKKMVILFFILTIVMINLPAVLIPLANRFYIVGVIMMLSEFVMIYLAGSLSYKLSGYKAIRQREASEKNQISQAKTVLTQFDQQIINTNQAIPEIENVLQNFAVTRNDFFSSNIIHPSYRDLESLEAIKHTLETQQAYSLTGPDGAYRFCDQIKFYNSMNQGVRTLNDKMDQSLNALNNIQFLQQKCLTRMKQIEDRVVDLTDAVKEGFARMNYLNETITFQQRIQNWELDQIRQNTRW